jgi:hypothetical protein
LKPLTRLGLVSPGPIVAGIGCVWLLFRFESLLCNCFGVSSDIEEPFFSGTADVDWERGEGAFGAERNPFAEFPLVFGRCGICIIFQLAIMTTFYKG